MNFKEITDFFHSATNLSVFIFNSQDEQIYLAKMTVAPTLPNSLQEKLLKHINQDITISIFSRIGSIATFRLNDSKFIIWAASSAITGNGKYDDKIPLIDFNTFKAQ